MKVLVPGSFDPITLGHVDVVGRAVALFDDVVVAVGRNSTKNYLFEPEERLDLCRSALTEFPGVEVLPMSGLLVEFARQQGAGAIVKGLRFASDFEYELQMAHLNRHLGGVETIFLPAGRSFGTISSSMLREVAAAGGDISAFVTPEVHDAVLAKVASRAR